MTIQRKLKVRSKAATGRYPSEQNLEFLLSKLGPLSEQIRSLTAQLEPLETEAAILRKRVEDTAVDAWNEAVTRAVNQFKSEGGESLTIEQAEQYYQGLPDFLITTLTADQSAHTPDDEIVDAFRFYQEMVGRLM